MTSQVARTWSTHTFDWRSAAKVGDPASVIGRFASHFTKLMCGSAASVSTTACSNSTHLGAQTDRAPAGCGARAAHADPPRPSRGGGRTARSTGSPSRAPPRCRSGRRSRRRGEPAVRARRAACVGRRASRRGSALSSSRGCVVPNQPSSSRNRSASSSAVRSISPRDAGLVEVEEGGLPVVGDDRPEPFRVPQRPGTGPVVEAPGDRVAPDLGPGPRDRRADESHARIEDVLRRGRVGPGAQAQLARASGSGRGRTSRSIRVLPPHATETPRTVPDVSVAGPLGSTRATGLRCRCGWTPPRLSSEVVAITSGSVDHRHSSAQPLPPKCVTVASSVTRRNGAAESYSASRTGPSSSWTTSIHCSSTPESGWVRRWCSTRRSRIWSRHPTTTCRPVSMSSLLMSSTTRRVLSVPSAWVTRSGVRRTASPPPQVG